MCLKAQTNNPKSKDNSLHYRIHVVGNDLIHPDFLNLLLLVQAS